MIDKSVSWKMNNKEYLGRLKSKEIIALEQTLGVGIFKVQQKMGMELVKTTLTLAALNLNPKMNSETFEADFEGELDNGGMPNMSSTAMELIRASGALGREAEEKKGDAPHS